MLYRKGCSIVFYEDGVLNNATSNVCSVICFCNLSMKPSLNKTLSQLNNYEPKLNYVFRIRWTLKYLCNRYSLSKIRGSVHNMP